MGTLFSLQKKNALLQLQFDKMVSNEMEASLPQGPILGGAWECLTVTWEMTSEAEGMGRSVFWRQEIGTEMQSNNLGQIAVARIVLERCSQSLGCISAGSKLWQVALPSIILDLKWSRVPSTNGIQIKSVEWELSKLLHAKC